MQTFYVQTSIDTLYISTYVQLLMFFTALKQKSSDFLPLIRCVV